MGPELAFGRSVSFHFGVLGKSMPKTTHVTRFRITGDLDGDGDSLLISSENRTSTRICVWLALLVLVYLDEP